MNHNIGYSSPSFQHDTAALQAAGAHFFMGQPTMPDAHHQMPFHPQQHLFFAHAGSPPPLPYPTLPSYSLVPVPPQADPRFPPTLLPFSHQHHMMLAPDAAPHQVWQVMPHGHHAHNTTTNTTSNRLPPFYHSQSTPPAMFAGSPFLMQAVQPGMMQGVMSSAAVPAALGPAHAKVLGGICTWVPLSDDEPRPIQRSGNPRRCEKLFIGQARHETTTSHIALMLETLCGVVPSVLRAAGKGCFILFVASDEDCRRVTSLHRRVLFDHGGVWFAATDESLSGLRSYVQSQAFHRACRRHLPVQCLVAEHQPEGEYPRGTVVPSAAAYASPSCDSTENSKIETCVADMGGSIANAATLQATAYVVGNEEAPIHHTTQ